MVPMLHHGTIQCSQKLRTNSHDKFQPSTEKEHKEEEKMPSQRQFLNLYLNRYK